MKKGPPTKELYYVINYTFTDRFFRKISNLKRHFLKNVSKCAHFNGQKVG